MVKTGVHVVIHAATIAVAGVVLMASDNGKSLILSFEGIVEGEVGTMAVLLNDDGKYRSIFTQAVVELEEVEPCPPRS